ncbi:MAG TPA: hypothetical protein DCP87_00615 [Lactobacillus sp.]|nr:hypothetical protein [Lactobacillus sp.]
MNISENMKNIIWLVGMGLYVLVGIYISNRGSAAGKKLAIKDYFLDTPRKSQSPYKEGTGGLTMWDIIEVHLMEQNMKPIELAEKKGISAETLRDLKSGRLKDPSFKLLEKIADVLRIDLNEFRGLD